MKIQQAILEVKKSDFEAQVRSTYSEPKYYFGNEGVPTSQRHKDFKVTGELNKWKEQDLQKWLDGGSHDAMANILLNDMCRKGLIQPGLYRIVVNENPTKPWKDWRNGEW